MMSVCFGSVLKFGWLSEVLHLPKGGLLFTFTLSRVHMARFFFLCFSVGTVWIDVVVGFIF